MGERSRETSVSPAERTIPGVAERTLAAPRFDEKSIQKAQPAVPLVRGDRTRRTWPTSVVILCLFAGLAGGVLGGLVLTLYQSDDTRAESPTATLTQVADAAPPVVESSPATTAANVPPARAEEENVTVKDSSEVAPEHVQPAQPTQAAGQHSPESEGGAGSVAAEGAALKSEAAGVADGGPEGADTKSTDAATQGELRSALDEWLAATNARDMRRQMQFYAPTVNAFYLSRNTSREAVRAEKSRVFAGAESVDVRASSAPDIRLSRDGQTAVMRFRKRYRIKGGVGARSGEVLQELRWRRTPSGWRIVSERDLRVIQ